MVCLDPVRDRDTDAKRWSWDEVMRQLKYRLVLQADMGVLGLDLDVHILMTIDTKKSSTAARDLLCA